MAAKMVFQAQHQVSIWAGTRENRVWGQAQLLRPLASSRIFQDLPLFAMLAVYNTVWNQLSKP